MLSFRTELEGIPETVQELVLAAEERYWEAFELLVQARDFAAIYLSGYCAEMLLKTATFRFDGALPGDLVEPRLGPAKTFGKAKFPTIGHESYHSLIFWSELLLSKRSDAGRPLSADLLTDLRLRVNRMYQSWWVSMRYRTAGSIVASPQPVALTILADVDWLLKHHSELWS